MKIARKWLIIKSFHPQNFAFFAKKSSFSSTSSLGAGLKKQRIFYLKNFKVCWRKHLCNGLIIALFVLVLSKAIRTQTDGFSLAKTTRCMQERPEWETPAAAIEPSRFKFLGSGVQFSVWYQKAGDQCHALF